MRRAIRALVLALAATTVAASPAPVMFVELAEGDGRVYDSRYVSMTVTREGRYTFVRFERVIFADTFEDDQ